MPTPRHAYVITPRITYVDGIALPTPADYADRGWGRLLTDVAGRLHGDQGVILLDAGAASAYGLPTTPDQITEVMDAHPCAEDARAHGWRVSRVSDWTTYTAKERPMLRVGILPLMKPEWTLLTGSPADVSHDVAEWHRRTGSAYLGTPGMAGLAILSDLYPPRGNGTHPAWRSDNAGPPDAFESDYSPTTWRGPAQGRLWAHGYDVNRSYVAAAQAVKLSPFALRRTGRVEWTPDRAGWWQVQLPEWTHRHLPDPAGYGPDGPEGERVRWVTGPTMGLLAQLDAQGWIGKWTVLDSWTGPAKEVLKPWAAKMVKAWQCPVCAERKDRFAPDDELCRVCQTVKDCGRQTLGMLDSPTSWVYRPDWWYGAVGMSRCNMFRRILRVGGGRPDGPGPWPLWVDVDNVWYGSDIEDPRVACPPGITPPTVEPIGTGLGQVKPKASKRRRTSVR